MPPDGAKPGSGGPIEAIDTPEQRRMMEMVTGHWLAQAISVAAKLGVADLIDKGPRSVQDLAEATKSHAPSLYRLMRALASRGIFTEVAPQVFGQTPLGRTLSSDAPGKARATAIAMAGPFQWQSMGELAFSVATGKAGSQKVFGLTAFQYLAEHPEEARWFSEAMIGVHEREPAAIAAAYDFSDARTVVDVGGGSGMLLATILGNWPHLAGVVFDMPSLAPKAREVVEAAGVVGRCRFVGGDFFVAVPEGDVQILSHVLHDWPDDRCAEILRRCRRAMAAGGRLLVIETVLAPGDTLDRAKLVDVVMLAVTGGRERTEAEYRTLLARAGFRLLRIVSTSLPDSILEAVAE